VLKVEETPLQISDRLSFLKKTLEDFQMDWLRIWASTWNPGK